MWVVPTKIFREKIVGTRFVGYTSITSLLYVNHLCYTVQRRMRNESFLELWYCDVLPGNASVISGFWIYYSDLLVVHQAELQFWALAASMKLSVSFRLLDLGQSARLLGRVISSSQGLCVSAPGDCEDGEVGGMNCFGRGNRSIRRNPAPTPLCPPQIPHELNWARNRVSAVGSRQLIAWAMARQG
jgi:hypothetical protein